MELSFSLFWNPKTDSNIPAARTNDAGRALSYFKRRGFSFREESAVYKMDGTLGAVYFREEIGGFAVHLVQK